MNASGQVAFAGVVSGVGVTSSNNQGVFLATGGVVSAVARTGTAALGPNLGAGVFFANFDSDSRNTVAMNGNGDLAFRSELNGTGVDVSNYIALYRRAGGTLSPVARTGTAGPGPNLGAGVSFADFSYPVLNGHGDVAFHGTLTGIGVNASNSAGLFISHDNVIMTIARQGSLGPGLDLGPGVHFNANFYAPTLNARGDVAFLADLEGTSITSANNTGLCVYYSGSLRVIVRDGDLFDVDPTAATDLRTISLITFYDVNEGAGGADGRGTGFSNTGVLAFGLKFTDGTSGIFTATVPEPASLMCLLPLLVQLRRRERTRQS